MRIPVIRGVIDRRILVNYRVDPAVLARSLPAPFRPKLHRGRGMVGICLIRLRGIRPRFVPSWLGIASENAAHRAAVEWDEQGAPRAGVYIRRRDTSSWLNAMAGGRVFPGVHSHARFEVHERDGHFGVNVRSDDGETNLSVMGELADGLPATSAFGSVAEAAAFFEGGAVGYSATPHPGRFQGLELRCRRWQMEPLRVSVVRSSCFDDTAVFPPGSIEFDCALVMRGIEHEWHGRPDLCTAAHAGTPQTEPLVTRRATR
jgi:hypothetical protein